MKLLHVIADNFKNCKDSFEIDFISKSKKQQKIKNMNFRKLPMDFMYSTRLHLLAKMPLEKQLQLNYLMPVTLFLVISDYLENHTALTM